MEKIDPESFVLVYRDRRRKWLVRPSETPKLHTHLGILDLTSLVGRTMVSGFSRRSTTSSSY